MKDNYKKSEIAGMIDHTLLKSDATESDIIQLCEEASKYEFASVCVNPYNVKVAKKMLKDTNVKVCVVIGFPLGANVTQIKTMEAKLAVDDGAQEVDMVINIGALKSKKFDYVKNEISSVVEAVKGKAIVKVIIETCLLSDEEKVKVCILAKEAKADFVKTSTGFSKSGATIEDVSLMYNTVKPDMKVKASGGIRTTEDALKLIKAGASRIGASASIKIVEGLQE